MADFYFQTLGQAWSAMAAAFTAANQLVYNESGFSITWTTSTAGAGGYFTVAGTTYLGSPYANGNYHAIEAKTAANLPLAYVLREQGMGDVPIVTHQTATGALTMATLLADLSAARAAAIVDICDATEALHGLTYLALNGASDAVGYAFTCGFGNNYDVGLDVFLVMDQAGQAGPAPVQFPAVPLYQTITIPATVVNVDVGPQLDTDQAINNGSTIQTVVGKQFTGI